MKKMALKLALLLQVAVLFTFRSTSAFAPHVVRIQSPVRGVQTTSPISQRVPPLPLPLPLPLPTTTTTTTTAAARRGLTTSSTALQSAKILPIAYTSAGAALLYRAVQATTKTDTAVLAATAAIALFNLGPTDNARLASAKIAFANTPPAVSGKAKQLRQAARTWRSVVRIKLIGQFVGLIWMAVAAGSTSTSISSSSSKGILQGAATVMAANMAYFVCGAGRAQHNDKGDPAPMPPGAATTILAIDTVLTAAALLAASSPVESTRRAVYAGIFVVGTSIGAIEGLANLIATRLRN
jgi:hypothetical protein